MMEGNDIVDPSKLSASARAALSELFWIASDKPKSCLYRYAPIMVNRGRICRNYKEQSVATLVLVVEQIN